MKIRTSPLVALAITITLGAAACGNDSPASDPTEPPPTTEPPETTTPSSEPGGTTPATTAPATTEPAGTAPDSTVPGTECEGDPTPESASEIVVGLNEEEAEEAVDECGWTLRVIRRDGEDLPMTLDLRPNRVNVEVVDGEVTAVLNIG